jgi:hypothetical protein
LTKLHGTLTQALSATHDYWEPLQEAYDWVLRTAHILGDEQASGDLVRVRLSALTQTLNQTLHGPLAAAKQHFLKVTHSYWPGLFACYDDPDLPRTNNGLEQFFGAFRYQQRRVSGRKQAGAALVTRGAARLLAATATRSRPVTAEELAAVDLVDWHTLRQELQTHRQRRVNHRRFKRDPQRYLQDLEERFLQSRLPS